MGGWNRVQGIQGAYAAGPVTSVSGTAGAAVAVGDTINVITAYDDATGTFTDTLSDQLGNVYTLVRRTTNATAQQGSGYYTCKVTVAGTPTIKQQFNPTPGTSTGQAVGFAADHFTGSDATSVLDGSNSQAQSSPGTGPDALTSGSVATAADGDLIWGGFQDGTTDGAIAAGTGFNAGTVMDGGAGALLLRTVWKVQPTRGSTAITGTATNGTDLYVSGGFALTPAAIVSPLSAGRPLRLGPGRRAPIGTAQPSAPPATTASYVLAAAAGSYSVTGNTTALQVGRFVGLSPGSYAIAGAAASLTLGHPLAAAPGTYAITGQATKLPTGRKLGLAAGAYSVTGQSAILRVGWKLGPAAGAYVLNGDAANLTASTGAAHFTLAAGVGSYSITGVSAKLPSARKLALTAGVYAETGSPALPRLAWHLGPGAGTFTLTGDPAGLTTASNIYRIPAEQQHATSGVGADVAMLDAGRGSITDIAPHSDATIPGANTSTATRQV